MGCRPGEVICRLVVALDVAPDPIRHRVHQVVGHIDIFQSLGHACGVQQVGPADFDAIREAGAQAGGIAHQAGEPVPGCHQLRDEPPGSPLPHHQDVRDDAVAPFCFNLPLLP
jgi:hypothetical protein